ncbi:MAG: rhodanese-like domain-containing protein [Polyangiaceae bacterium]
MKRLVPALLAVALAGCGNTAAKPDATASNSTASTSGSKKEITENNLPEMTVDEVEAAIAKPGALYVFDANPKDVYDEGHVPGAKWVGKELTADLLPSDKNAKLVFYCANEH